jgi:hypothetical protein
MAQCISHSQCPQCASRGQDKHANNLGNYSDNSVYCFSCGYYKSKNKLQTTKTILSKPKKQISIPYDSTQHLEKKPLEYLQKYRISIGEQKQHLILWSPSWERIIFPLFSPTELLGWQGRYLGNDPKKAKWFSQGDLKSIKHLIGNKNSPIIILTEDIISAINIGKLKYLCSSPIFGSHITTQQLQQYKLLNFQTIIIWLDKDKEKESLKFAYKARQLGFNCLSIITNKDPKEYIEKELQEILQEKQIYDTSIKTSFI